MKDTTWFTLPGVTRILGSSFRHSQSRMARRNGWSHFENQFLASEQSNSNIAKQSVISSEVERSREIT